MGKLKIGYNSYSDRLRPLYEIYREERVKENDGILSEIRRHYPNKKAMQNVVGIWVDATPESCFKHYVLDPDAFFITDEEVRQNYPDYINYVTPVNLRGLKCILDDEYAGMLFVKELPIEKEIKKVGRPPKQPRI